MKPISTALENIFQSVQLREDEYLDEESKLIYCSRCRTPRQKRFEMTGKSFIAGCIANALLDQGVPVMMTNFARFLNKLTDMYSGDRNAYINSFNSFPLLIIDDLGVERNSEFAREQVFNIIDSRYRSQLPIIVTTNLTVDELKKPADLARARIYDRVLERCTAIKVNDQNIRKLNMTENLARAKQLLEGVTI